MVSTQANSGLDSEAIRADLKTKILTQVRSRRPSIASKNLTYHLENKHQTEAIPERAAAYRFGINKKGSFIGRTGVPLFFLDRHNDLVKKSMLYVDVDWVGPVVTSVGILRKGNTIVSSDVQVVTKSLNIEPVRHLSSVSDVIGKEVAITVPSGATLTSWTVKEKSVVRAGQKVFLLTDRSNVQLRIRGTALEDGYAGQEIRVRTLLEKSKIMKGTVIDHETIRIHLLY